MRMTRASFPNILERCEESNRGLNVAQEAILKNPGLLQWDGRKLPPDAVFDDQLRPVKKDMVHSIGHCNTLYDSRDYGDVGNGKNGSCMAFFRTEGGIVGEMAAR